MSKKHPKNYAPGPSQLEMAVDQDEIDDGNEMISLLGKSSHKKKFRHKSGNNPSSPLYNSAHAKEARARASILAVSLFLNLGIFWLLDSLKDPVFAILLGDDDENNSNFEQNQPLAKMASVLSTFVLVYVLEIYMKSPEPKKLNVDMDEDESEWQVMKVSSSQESVHSHDKKEGNIPAMSMISHVHIPYSIFFFIIAVLLGRYPTFDNEMSPFFSGETSTIEKSSSTSTEQAIVGYVVYVAIESFGSLSVAAFWSYSNSNLDIESAKKNYGLIIAAAQIGAILGSTVAALEFMSIPHMFLLCSALMICNMMLMIQYHIWYPFPLENVHGADDEIEGLRNSKVTQGSLHREREKMKQLADPQHNATEKDNKSGLLLIFKHDYLLSILAVSCLYEIALTCLDYEMKLVGLSRFNLSQQNSTFSFKTFMGRYGQLTNLLSLFLSFFGFPYLMERYGVKFTLRLFPGFLVILTIFTFTILPSNLWLLFYSMAALKAMTYSINDPAKEILYMPTTSTIKVKAKFWIDVVGARFAKALGSSITNYAGSADRIVKVGGVPSVLSSLIFLYFCVKVGEEFEILVRKGKVVGEDDDDENFQKYDVTLRHYDDDDIDDNYLEKMDPFSYKSRGEWESEPEERQSSNLKADTDEGWNSDTNVQIYGSEKK